MNFILSLYKNYFFKIKSYYILLINFIKLRKLRIFINHVIRKNFDLKSINKKLF